MTNLMIPNVFQNVKEFCVMIRKHVIIGGGCMVLPGSSVGEGAAVRAMSFVSKDLASVSMK